MIDEDDFKNMKYIWANRWIRIGILKEIRIYPLDTGHGFNIRNAVCTKNGLQSFSLSKRSPNFEPRFRYTDRTLVPYHSTKDGYSSLLHSPILTECKDQTVFHNMQNTATINGGRWHSKVGYFKDNIKLYDLGYDLKHSIMGNIGEVGFISPQERRTFISQYRSKFENDRNSAFLSNFYPYSLINSTSLDLLRKENPDCQNLSVETFSPNLVIEANMAYCEDEIVDLIIGEKVRFCNIVPCTHQFGKYDKVLNRWSSNKFFNVLKKTRSLRKVHPYLSTADLPVFGINLEVVQSGQICLNDDVYAKFRDTPIDTSKNDNDDVSDVKVEDEAME